VVISSQPESKFVTLRKEPLSLDLTPLARDLLVHIGCAQPEIPRAHANQEITAIIKANLAGARDFEPDCIRIGAGGDHEVILELALIAVINQINAGINLFVVDPLEGGNACVPLLRIISNEIVASPRQLVGPGDDGVGLGPRQFHS
jgi:hypothetical protein